MWPSLKPSQRMAVMAAIDSVSSNAAKNSGWVDASQFENFMALIDVGVMQAGGTLDAKIQQAQDNAGTGAKDIAGKAIVQITQGGGGGGQQCLINVKQDDLDVNNGYGFIQLTLTPAVAASLVGGYLIGVDPRYGPADQVAPDTQVQVVG